VSGGRFLFGVGAGWNLEELRNHGTDPATRFRLLRERIEAMKRIWTEDDAQYDGTHVQFEPLWSWPKPVQEPHPPIVVGGNGPHTFRHVLEYGDEWMPIRGRGPIEERIQELQRLAAEAGRAPIPVSLYMAAPDAAEIERLAASGVDRFIFGLPSAGADEVLPLVQEQAAVIKAFS
jgi:alkanesulfonate monooxygenase SsuD/methylene tetrahydromethanopterin reductase-like flavin-dependent oxidoreductase (luciferase family)